VTSIPILAVAHAAFAVVGVLLLAAVVYGLTKRLFKVAVFPGGPIPGLDARTELERLSVPR